MQVVESATDGFAKELKTMQIEDTMATPSQLQNNMPFHTFLQEGHLLSPEDKDAPLNRQAAMLAVPRKIFLDINIKTGEHSNKRVFADVNDTVATLKGNMSSKRFIAFPTSQAGLYDTYGNLLQDTCLLRQLACDSTNDTPAYLQIVCIQHHPDSTAVAPAFADKLPVLANQWRAIKVGDEPARLTQHLSSALATALASLPGYGSAGVGEGGTEDEEELPTSTYSPPPSIRKSAAAATSPEFERVKACFAAAAAGVSACPALGAQAVALLDDVAAALAGTNPGLAAKCAAAVDPLRGAVECLASRVPRQHRHETYAAQIREAERALELHRSIRAGKMEAYNGSENRDAMRQALAATETVSPPVDALARSQSSVLPSHKAVHPCIFLPLDSCAHHVQYPRFSAASQL